MSECDITEHTVYKEEERELWRTRFIDTDDFFGSVAVFIKRTGSYRQLPEPNDDFVRWEDNSVRIDLATIPMRIMWEEASSKDEKVLAFYAKEVEMQVREDKGLIFSAAWNDMPYAHHVRKQELRNFHLYRQWSKLDDT